MRGVLEVKGVVACVGCEKGGEEDKGRTIPYTDHSTALSICDTTVNKGLSSH